MKTTLKLLYFAVLTLIGMAALGWLGVRLGAESFWYLPSVVTIGLVTVAVFVALILALAWLTEWVLDAIDDL